MKRNTSYSVSDSTNKLINVIVAFDDATEMLVDAIDGRYSDSQKILDDYCEAASPARDFLLRLMASNIDDNLGKIGNTQI